MYTISQSIHFRKNNSKALTLLHDNTIFELTGADKIQRDFTRGGLFQLIFENRGEIFGHFIKISENELLLDWNVKGFQRPVEIHTLLQISLALQQHVYTLSIHHSNIMNEDSANAKRKAWMEILQAIKLKYESEKQL